MNKEAVLYVLVKEAMFRKQAAVDPLQKMQGIATQLEKLKSPGQSPTQGMVDRLRGGAEKVKAPSHPFDIKATRQGARSLQDSQAALSRGSQEQARFGKLQQQGKMTQTPQALGDKRDAMRSSAEMREATRHGTGPAAQKLDNIIKERYGV
jgi:hypothetical protein